MENRDLLEIRNLSAKYPYGGNVLHDVSLRVRSGEIVCVIGESGCGKSTLLSAILRMPGGADITGGSVLYHGTDLCAMPPKKLRKIRGSGIGMVFQEPGASLDPIRRIGAQFYEAMRAHGDAGKRECLAKAAQLLAKMELADPERVLGNCPVQLSGGMNQRVAIALSMSLSPDLLLADEPTSALDVTVQAQITRELLQLRDTFGTGILLVTHNMGVVAKLADRVAVMYGGRVVEYGGRELVLKQAAHPYTRALMAAIPRLDGTPPKGIPGQKSRGFADGCAFAPRCRFASPGCETCAMAYRRVHDDHWTLCAAGPDGGAA